MRETSELTTRWFPLGVLAATAFGLAACMPEPPPLCDTDFSISAVAAPCPPPPPPPPPCSGCPGITGDPHIRTFDGYRYDLQAAGELTAVVAGDLEVQVRMEPSGERVSSVTAVAMLVDGDRFTVTPGSDAVVIRRNGFEVELSSEESVLLGEGMAGFGPDGEIVVEWPDGSVVVVDVFGSFSNVVMQLAVEREAEARGLMGVPDGDPNNDLQTRDGELVGPDPDFEELYEVYAESWRVSGDTTLFDYADGESTESFTDRGFPPERVTVDDLDPAARAEAEEVCRAAGVTDPETLDDCILDVVLTDDPEYADAAAEAQTRLGLGDGMGAAVGAGAMSWVTQLDGLQIREPGEVDDGAGHVLVHAADEGDGVLVALDADDGSESWRVAGIEPNCPALPLGDGRIAVVGANDGPLGLEGLASRTLAILDADTGEVIAGPAAPDTDRGEPSFEPCRYTNATSEGVALYSNSLTVWAWDVGGEEPELAWWRERRPAVHNLAVVGDTVIHAAGTEDGEGLEAVLLDVATGEVLDRVDLPGRAFEAGPTAIVLSGSTAVFTTVDDEDDEGIEARLIGIEVDGTDMSRRWVTEMPRNDDSDSELPGRLRSLTAVDDVVVGHVSGVLVGVRVEDGKQAWVYDPPLFRNTDMPAVAGPDGVLYDGTFGGPFLFAVSAEGEPLWELAHEDLFGEDSPVSHALTFGPVMDDQVIVGTVAPGDTPVVVAVSLSEDAGAAGHVVFDITFGR